MKNVRQPARSPTATQIEEPGPVFSIASATRSNDTALMSTPEPKAMISPIVRVEMRIRMARTAPMISDEAATKPQKNNSSSTRHPRRIAIRPARWPARRSGDGWTPSNGAEPDAQAIAALRHSGRVARHARAARTNVDPVSPASTKRTGGLPCRSVVEAAARRAQSCADCTIRSATPSARRRSGSSRSQPVCSRMRSSR